MSTAVIEREAVQNALPACLCPWLENPYRLVSLLDMQKFYAATLTTITWQLNSLWMNIGAPDSVAKIMETLQQLKVEADRLDWSDLSAQVDRFIRRLSSPGMDTSNFEAMTTLFVELTGNVQHHLTRDLFLCIQKPKIDYILRPREIFGQQVLDSFPSAAYDLLEGSTCFALDRWTATVFHLMRALEASLSVLGAVFNVSLAHTNWAPAIEQIESRVRDMHKDPIWKAMPDCKEQREFYAQAVSHFGVLKDAWRNYTAHIRGKYDEREAADIMTSVRAFLQKLATRLHE
jgi:hypothetical protein